MGTACSSNRGKEKCIYVIGGKARGKERPLGRPIRRSVDNIKMDILEIGWGSVDWIGLAQDRDKWRALVNVVRTFGFHKCWETVKWLHNWWPLE
jgi:hypothetical protein